MSLLRSTIAVSFSILLLSPLLAVSATTIKIGSFLPPQSQTHSKVFTGLAGKLEGESGGTITTSLIAGTDYSLDPILNGELDITFVPPSLVSKYFPDSHVMEMPGLLPQDVEKASEVHQKLYNSGAMTQPDNLRVIAAGSAGYWTAHLSFPFDGLDSFRGKKTEYSPDVPVDEIVFGSLGAVPVEIPLGGGLKAMESGELEIALQNWSGASYLWNILPAVEEHVHMNFGHIPALLVVNAQTYAKLDEQQKEAFDVATGEWLATLYREALIGGHFRALELVKANGKPITEVSAGDQKILDELYDQAIDKWTEDYPGGAEIIKRVKEMI